MDLGLGHESFCFVQHMKQLLARLVLDAQQLILSAIFTGEDRQRQDFDEARHQMDGAWM